MYAEEFFVPSAAYPTIQSAAAAAEASDEPNFINITETLIVGDVITINVAIAEDNPLVIRPGPGLSRARIIGTDGSEPVFRIESSHVTLQDLDILRNAKTLTNLVELWGSHEIVQRCRLGSIWPELGVSGHSVLYIYTARETVVRNCICFAVKPGTFDYGIRSVVDTALGDQSLFLYNNDVADYAVGGIFLQGTGDRSLYLLRNNVLANHPSLVPPPHAFVSSVHTDVEVESSHNSAVAAAASVELENEPAQPIAGTDQNFLLIEQPPVTAFVRTVWIPEPDHANPDFYRLFDGGPLHNGDPARGADVNDVPPPHLREREVLDDIEGDPRPSGRTPHIDRGADQIEVDLYAADWVTIDGGGGVSTGGEYSLSGTIGQPDAGVMSGGKFSLIGGFWGVALARPELPPPVLRIRRSGNAVIVSWPNPSTGFQLQMTSSLTPLAGWINVSQTPVVVDGESHVIIPDPVEARFYRLRKP
jgi:hypothetical protein